MKSTIAARALLTAALLAALPIAALTAAHMQDGAAAPAASHVITGRVLACGGPEVLHLTVRFRGDTAEIVSRTDWGAATSRGMPAEMVPLFRTTDECKPIDGGERVLITSSSGGVAIVERDSGDTLFHATVPNAHSAEVLPQDRVVVAASVKEEGNRLILFDRARSGVELFSTPLLSAHGAHWVEAEQTLWALGRTELRAYGLVDWESAKPSLKLRQRYTLPSDGGHDLSPVPGASSFIVTTQFQVLMFDRRTGEFEPYDEIGAHRDVKSVSIHPTTGRVVFIQADPPEWWSHTMRFLEPAATLAFPKDRLYKARWLPLRQPPPGL